MAVVVKKSGQAPIVKKAGDQNQPGSAVSVLIKKSAAKSTSAVSSTYTTAESSTIKLIQADELPTGYKHMERNVYVSREEHKMKPDDIPECSCTNPSNCSPSTCINAVVYTECVPDRCPCGPLCLNQRFQKKQYAGVKPKRSGAKGWGVFAELPISKGQFVIEYVGEVIDTEELESRSKEYANEPHFYVLTLSAGETIDASRKGNFSRFINHSCDPNCITQKWQVLGEIRVGIFALRNIGVGEEITFDYKFERFGQKKQRCLCGSANCCKYLGSKPKKQKKEDESSSEEDLTEIYKVVPIDDHMDTLLEDQTLTAFPFIPVDGRWYSRPESDIPWETDSSWSESSDDDDSSTEDTTTNDRKSSKTAEGSAPPARNGSEAKKLKRQKRQHRARDLVNKLPGKPPLFLRANAYKSRLMLLDSYNRALYDHIDASRDKKQSESNGASTSSLFVDASSSWIPADADLKELIKAGLLEVEPLDAAERAQMRRASTRRGRANAS